MLKERDESECRREELWQVVKKLVIYISRQQMFTSTRDLVDCYDVAIRLNIGP